jgi:hypothetical protein
LLLQSSIGVHRVARNALLAPQRVQTKLPAETTKRPAFRLRGSPTSPLCQG